MDIRLRLVNPLKRSTPVRAEKTVESPALQGVPVERTTRFEPATLTLAR